MKGVSGGCCGVSFPFVEVLLLIATSVAKQVATNRMTRFRWVFTRLGWLQTDAAVCGTALDPSHMGLLYEDSYTVDTSRPIT